MADSDVELVRAVFAGWQAGRTMLEAFDEHVEWDYSLFPDGDVEYGHDGVRRFVRRWLGTWDEYELAVERVFPARGCVVAFTRERGRGKGSAVPVELEATMLFTVQEGKIVRFRAYRDRAEGLAEAGVDDQAPPDPGAA